MQHELAVHATIHWWPAWLQQEQVAPLHPSLAEHSAQEPLSASRQAKEAGVGRACRPAHTQRQLPASAARPMRGAQGSGGPSAAAAAGPGQQVPAQRGRLCMGLLQLQLVAHQQEQQVLAQGRHLCPSRRHRRLQQQETSIWPKPLGLVSGLGRCHRLTSHRRLHRRAAVQQQGQADRPSLRLLGVQPELLLA